MEAIDPSHGLGKAAEVLGGIVGWWFCWTRLDTHLSTAFGIMRIFLTNLFQFQFISNL